jgi:inosose dehydratase
MNTNRRVFLENIAGLGGGALLANLPVKDAFAAPPYPVSCNVYTWYTFFGRENRDWSADLDRSMEEYAQSGLKAFEPSLGDVAEVAKLAPALKKHTIAMPSVYIGSVLHNADEAKKSMQSFLAIADAVRPLGTKIVVTNPNPIRWGGAENKNDAELEIQAKNLDVLGAELRKRGMTLAYHNHDVELRAGAREFHHMLAATNPNNVKFCFDVHWVYRGCANSQVAVFDVLKLYGKRVVELHIRQSVDGVWSEVFGDGDIDYGRFAKELKSLGLRPHLVLEQCLEEKSAKTISAVEATKQSLVYAKKVFAPVM